jgi:SAM-dependent methyltransferase
LPLGWMDTSAVSFNALLLLERVQLSWLPNWHLPQEELALALRANPAVAWYLGHKCPPIAAWVDGIVAKESPAASPTQVRAAEQAVLARLEDLLVYVLDPAIYDAQPFLAWDDRELTGLADFRAQVVIDVGSGTGRLAFAAARAGAAAVYAVEPVGNLRANLRAKAQALGLTRVYPADGLITAIPFADDFAGITMGGHVFGDEPQAELAELERVTRPGGTIILCPGNNDQDNEIHAFLLDHGCAWGRFEEPRDGWKRSYWKHI